MQEVPRNAKISTLPVLPGGRTGNLLICTFMGTSCIITILSISLTLIWYENAYSVYMMQVLLPIHGGSNGRRTTLFSAGDFLPFLCLSDFLQSMGLYNGFHATHGFKNHFLPCLTGVN